MAIVPLADSGPGSGVVVTGLGAVSPLGVGVGAYVNALRRGASGVRGLSFEHELVRTPVAAAVGPDLFDPRLAVSEADVKRLPRLVPMALHAAREAMAQAGLALAPGGVGAGANAGGPGAGSAGGRAVETLSDAALARSRRVGLVLGTGGGGIDFTLDQYSARYAGGRASLWTITNATHGNLAGELSIQLGARGPSWCVSTGCASSSDACGMALAALRAGSVDAMIVLGADAHVRWETLHTMELLGVISTRPAEPGEDLAQRSRPFDATRDGFVLGEGAWAVLLERAQTAAARGARPLASLRGYAATCDAFHRVRPHPDMTEAVRAMRDALADAGLPPEAVGVLHYHGTATRLNDELETRAVALAFGAHARRLVGHSVKGAIGHPQGACGAASIVATLGAMAGLDGSAGFLPPTAHLRRPDPACDLDYSPLAPRPLADASSPVVLVNCLAFGAKNSALVFDAGARP